MKRKKAEGKEEANLGAGDVGARVHFTISKHAFQGPFTCHRRKTNLVQKIMRYAGLQYQYAVWECPVCKKELLDVAQANHLESFWMIQHILENKLISIERTINYDGKTFFVRFPTSITQNWKKHETAEIKILGPRKMLIEVKG